MKEFSEKGMKQCWAPRQYESEGQGCGGDNTQGRV